MIVSRESVCFDVRPETSRKQYFWSFRPKRKFLITPNARNRKISLCNESRARGCSASSPMLFRHLNLSRPWNRYRPRRKTILRRGLLGFFSDNFLFLIFFTQCRFEIAVNQKNQQNQNDQRNGAEQNVGHNVTVLGSCNGQRPTQIFFRHGS